MISFLVSVVHEFAEKISIKYKAMMMRLALQITGNNEDAEEAFQDALLSVHRCQDRIKDINSADARNYIYTITKNAALKIRKNSQSMILGTTFVKGILCKKTEVAFLLHLCSCELLLLIL